MNEFENAQVTEDTQDWNPDLMETEEETENTSYDAAEESDESVEDSTAETETIEANESEENTSNDFVSDREIQCAACGNISKQRDWFLSRIGKHYIICPKCGTLRYVCSDNAGYRKE